MSNAPQDTPQSPQGAVQLSMDQFVAIVDGYLNVMIVGLCTCNPQIPQAMRGQALVRAAGRCFSRNTKTAVPAQTIALRDQFLSAFEDELRRHVPALDRALNVPPPANGNLPPHLQ